MRGNQQTVSRQYSSDCRYTRAEKLVYWTLLIHPVPAVSWIPPTTDRSEPAGEWGGVGFLYLYIYIYICIELLLRCLAIRKWAQSHPNQQFKGTSLEAGRSNMGSQQRRCIHSWLHGRTTYTHSCTYENITHRSTSIHIMYT